MEGNMSLTPNVSDQADLMNFIFLIFQCLIFFTRYGSFIQIDLNLINLFRRRKHFKLVKDNSTRQLLMTFFCKKAYQIFVSSLND